MKTTFLPGWIWPWGVVAALAAGIGVQQLRIGDIKVELAQAKQAASDENTRRMAAALEFQQMLDRESVAHASAQQSSEDMHNDKVASLQRDRDRRAADNVRLRDQIAAFTAGDRRPGESDAAAFKRAADRLQLVGRLLAEGTGLVDEGIGIVKWRDAEVGRLQDQIRIDREACAAR